MILPAASEDSVLVSRAVNININDITLKPAGKDTHSHTYSKRKGGLYLHIYTPNISTQNHLHIQTLPAMCHIYAPTFATL